jgi:hypothetical protein
LSVIYEESPVDMQRLALYQGWTTILVSSLSKPEQPAYALFATREGRKQVVLAIRGTASVHDIITDIRATPVNFPPSKEEIDEILKSNKCGDGYDVFNGVCPEGGKIIYIYIYIYMLYIRVYSFMNIYICRHIYTSIYLYLSVFI